MALWCMWAGECRLGLHEIEHYLEADALVGVADLGGALPVGAELALGEI